MVSMTLGECRITFLSDGHVLTPALYSLTLEREKDITAFEAKRSQETPWLDGFGYSKSSSVAQKLVPVVEKAKDAAKKVTGNDW